MHVIEIKGVFNRKWPKQSITEIIKDCYFEKSTIKANNRGATKGSYTRAIRKSWNDNNLNIKELYKVENLIGADKTPCQSKYFIFKEDMDSVIGNSNVTLNIVVISESSHIQDIVSAIYKRVKKIISKGIKFDLTATKCRAYIFNRINNDIHGTDYHIDFEIRRTKRFKDLKYEITKCIFILLAFIISFSFYKNEVMIFYRDFLAATAEESMKMNLSITIGINLITGVFLTLFFELIALFVHFFILRKGFSIGWSAEIAMDNFDSSLIKNKSALGRTGEGLEEGIPTVPTIPARQSESSVGS